MSLRELKCAGVNIALVNGLLQCRMNILLLEMEILVLLYCHITKKACIGIATTKLSLYCHITKLKFYCHKQIKQSVEKLLILECIGENFNLNVR